MKKIALVLAGCGSMDGSEIREAVCSLVSLDRALGDKKYAVCAMAPDRAQHHVMNHLERKEMRESRNMMVEAARIARGEIVDFLKESPEDYEALVIPGGFGVAKNLCDYAFKGIEGHVDDHLSLFIRHMYEHKKPIAAVCIAPALLALVLGKEGIEITLGDDEKSFKEILKTGAKHVKTSPGEIHLDLHHKIVTTAAYMHDQARLFEVALGIDRCMAELVALLE